MKMSSPKLLSAIQRLDIVAFDWCHQRKHRILFAAIARRLSRSADGWLYVLLPLLYLAAGSQGAETFIGLALIAFAVERLVYFVLKNTCRRRRPPDLLPGFRSLVIASDKFSFPSGHTSAAFLFSGLCAGEFGPLAAILLYPWACAVGASRVILGVHFPTDIVAGAALGSSILLVARQVLAS